jgi:hypothetical protein
LLIEGTTIQGFMPTHHSHTDVLLCSFFLLRVPRAIV